MKKTIIGVFLIVISLVGIVGWEMIGREKVMFEDILVLTKDVKEHDVITEKDLAVMSVYKPNSECLRLDSYEYIIGKEASQFIHNRTELYDEYFNEMGVSVNKEKGEKIYTLTKDELTVMPPGIKKGSMIELWSDGQKIFKTVVLNVKDANGNEIIKKDGMYEDNISYIEIIANNEAIEDLSLRRNEGLSLVPVYQE